MGFRSLVLPIVLATAAAAPAGADDIRVYHGVVDSGTYAVSGTDLRKRRTYLVVDHTTFQIGFIYYDPKMRTHTEAVYPSTFDAIRPSPPVPESEQFIYAGAPEPGLPVDVHRLRSAGKLTMQPISSSASAVLAKRLSYASFFVALAAYNSEASGTFKYQKKLTIAANDVFHDMTTAIELVLDDLRARDVID